MQKMIDESIIYAKMKVCHPNRYFFLLFLTAGFIIRDYPNSFFVQKRQLIKNARVYFQC